MLLARRNSLFDDFFNDPFFTDSIQNRRSLMKTDIEDDGTNYLIDIELPGYKKEDIRAELKEGYLSVFADMSVSNEETDEKKKFIRKERYCGSCKRTFYVGTGLRQEDIKASFDNGILKLSIPKEAPKQLEENNLITIE